MLSPAIAAEQTASVLYRMLHFPVLPLGLFTFPKGKALNLTISYGSGAFHSLQQMPGRIWTISDRGPNFACSEAKPIAGMDVSELCNGNELGRAVLFPTLAPTIYAFDFSGERLARLATTIPLKGASGKPLTGKSSPYTHNARELNYGTDGKLLEPDPSALDPEALIRMNDGSFWIAEEYGPSIAHIASDGTVLRRLVPEGQLPAFKGADYLVEDRLPSVLARRIAGRGFEALSVSPDEKFLYFITQSPLSLPGGGDALGSRSLRLMKYDIAQNMVVAQYLYQLELPQRFGKDFDQFSYIGFDVGVREMVALGRDKFLVMERINETARFYKIDLSKSTPLTAAQERADAQPVLEELTSSQISQHGLIPVAKEFIFDTDQLPGIPGRLEAMALLNPRQIMVFTDHAFGIDGPKKQPAVVLTLDALQ